MDMRNRVALPVTEVPHQMEAAMADEMKNSQGLVQSDETKARRELLKKAGKFSITAPMAYLLLSVSNKKKQTALAYNGMTQIDPPSLQL